MANTPGAAPKRTRSSDPTQTPTEVVDGVKVNPSVPNPIPAPVELPPFISEGTAKEIEMYGHGVDPRNGNRLDKSDLPKGR